MSEGKHKHRTYGQHGVHTASREKLDDCARMREDRSIEDCAENPIQHRFQYEFAFLFIGFIGHYVASQGKDEISCFATTRQAFAAEMREAGHMTRSSRT
jgi:hypothetical protein